jgi:hypothetical protein
MALDLVAVNEWNDSGIFQGREAGNLMGGGIAHKNRGERKCRLFPAITS